MSEDERPALRDHPHAAQLAQLQEVREELMEDLHNIYESIAECNERLTKLREKKDRISEQVGGLMDVEDSLRGR